MRKLLLASALCLGSAVWSAAPAEEIRIDSWPDDVPCDAIRKNHDGSYTQLKDIVVGGAIQTAGSLLKNKIDRRVWDRKCAGKGGGLQPSPVDRR
jgi:hypothetical protein